MFMHPMMENYTTLKTYLLHKKYKTLKFHIKSRILTPGNDPTGLVYLGKNLLLHSDASTGKLYKINVKSKKIVEIKKLPIDHPWGMCIDKATLWITDDIKRIILNINIEDLTINKIFDYSKKDVPQLKFKPDLHGIIIIGDKLFVNDWSNNCILQIDKENGKVLKRIDIKIPDLSGLLYFNDSIWVASSMVSYLFRINKKGQITGYLKLMKGNYNHIHALTTLKNKEIGFTSKNKNLIIIGEII